MKQFSTYHRILRVAVAVFALVLVFQSGIITQSTARIASGTHAYLANAIGMSASVEPTELNQYTAALTEKERELEAREAALKEREVSVTLSEGQGLPAQSNSATYILASILFILLVLILLNYALDYVRARENRRVNTKTV